MSKKGMFFLGNGGHARSCLEVYLNTNSPNFLGYVDIIDSKIIKSNFHSVIHQNDIEKYFADGFSMHVAIGSYKNLSKRHKLFSYYKNYFNFPAIISNLSYVSKNAIIGEGTIIFNNTFINGNVEIGKNCIVNNKSLIEHDVKIGNNSHIATGAIINGSCNIGNNVFIGSGALIKEGVSVGDNTIVGMGSIVLRDIKKDSIFYNKLISKNE